MESRVQPTIPASREEKEAAEGACRLNLSPEERKSVIDALLQEIDKTQKWTRVVVENQREIDRLRGDLEVMRLQRDAAAGEVEKLRSRLRLADAALRSESPTLTEAEREAVRFCVTASLPETEKLGGVAGGLCRMHAATLRGLLERLK